MKQWCFSTEEVTQLAITEISTYEGWRAELYKPIRKPRYFERETEKPDYSNKEHEQIKNNEISSKQVELNYIFKRRNKIHKKNTRHTTEEAVTRDTKRQRRFHRY